MIPLLRNELKMSLSNLLLFLQVTRNIFYNFVELLIVARRLQAEKIVFLVFLGNDNRFVKKQR